MTVRFLGKFYRIVNITFVADNAVAVTYFDEATSELRLLQMDRKEFLATCTQAIL